MKWIYRLLTVLLAPPGAVFLAAMLILSWPLYITGFYTRMASKALRRWGFQLIGHWQKLVARGWSRYGQ